MSFDIALSGLNAAQTDLDVIAHNVANSSTNGFKKSRAEFADIYAVTQNGVAANATGKGVRVTAVTAQHSQGDISFTESNLDLAISGRGFFRLNDQGSTVFSRAGTFQIDREGFVVNSAGQVLTGFQADAAGNLTGALGDLQVNFAESTPNPTGVLTVGANLDALETIPPAFSISDPSSFNHSTSLTVYDSLGASHVATLYFRKDAVNTWETFTYVDGAEVSNPGGDLLVFDTAGQLSTINGAPASTVSTTSFNPGSGAANMTMTLDMTTLTQFGGGFGVSQLIQDGFPTGRLNSIDIDETGVMFARFSNGRSGILGQVALSNFANIQGLQAEGDTSFSETFASGAAITAEPGSTNLGLIQSGALEQSNVDLTAELVDMITAQRNFQANAQVVSAAEEITQTIINIGR
jgi:flagellar hook protein FlgE